MEEEYLQHYGVLGMKWGVRKQKIKTSIGNAKKSVRNYRKSQKHYHKNINAKKRHKYRDINSLSDVQLRARINRLQLERQYASMLRDQKYAVAVGKNVSEDILYKTGNQLVSQSLKKGGKALLKL